MRPTDKPVRATIATIRRVAEGDDLLKEENQSAPRRGRAHRGRGPPVHGGRGVVVSPLTPRELEIMQLVARGESNREIAAKLAIGESKGFRAEASGRRPGSRCAEVQRATLFDVTRR